MMTHDESHGLSPRDTAGALHHSGPSSQLQAVTPAATNNSATVVLPDVDEEMTDVSDVAAPAVYPVCQQCISKRISQLM
jgi:hypothetical protein